jgi:sec-independent protein translocase protein TatA
MNAFSALSGFLNPANMHPMEMVIVLAIVLLIFGPKKLPGLGKAVGKSIREFKDGIKGLNAEIKDGVDGEDEPKADLDPKPAMSKNDASSADEEPAKSS